MSIEGFPPLPENTCAYERFDPQTLEPLNDETYVRIQELGWRAEDFAGRSVLDIGCNSGLLSLHALRLGASKVDACDVQLPFVQFFAALVKEKDLPITVTQAAFGALDLDDRRADVVLFMEVLHWVVSQGLDLRDVIRRLASLTGELLYLEFPWSVAEPSIQKQTKLTAETYSADAVLDELTRYFRHVRVVRFMRYFGFGSESQRVLIEAREKRPEASVLEQLPGVHSLDIALSHGSNESYLLASARGPLVAKLLSRENRIALLPDALTDGLFDELNEHRPKTIVAPAKLNQTYLLPAPSGRSWILFPFVGLFPLVGKRKPFPVDPDLLLEVFVDVRRDLRPLSSGLLTELRAAHFFPDWQSAISHASIWGSEDGGLRPCRDGALALLEEAPSAGAAVLDAVCHGDLQTGNIIYDRARQPRVVDLDNLSLGTIYSDGLIGLIWRGVSAEMLEKFCSRLQKEESRAVNRFDLAFAVAIGLLWYSNVESNKPAALVPDQIDRLRAGIESALAFAQKC